MEDSCMSEEQSNECSTDVACYKSRLVALLEGLEVVKPNEAAELSELHLRAIGERIADAARIGANFR